MGGKGQTSLEYLILVSMIIFIGAVLAAFVYTYFLVPQKSTIPVTKDKQNCQIGNEKWIGFDEIELINYNTPYDGTATTKPQAIKRGSAIFEYDTTGSPPTINNKTIAEVCRLQNEYPLIYDIKGRAIYLQNKNSQYYVYKVSGGTTGSTTITVSAESTWSSSQSATSSCSSGSSAQTSKDDEYQMKFDIDSALSSAGKSRSDITALKLSVDQTLCTGGCGATDGEVGQIDETGFKHSSATMKNTGSFDLSGSLPTTREITLNNNILSNVSDPVSSGQNLYIAIKKSDSVTGYAYYCNESQLLITVS
ncbi:MAG: hypothetical protein J7L23_01660 [Candidatus Diapherotrites archaeon]|nr:hypothetical protein [Candidatus Diapherotrites archaeon]